MMQREEIFALARRLVRPGATFVLATVGEDGGPRMRWMGDLVVDEGLVVYMAAMSNSRKMDQVRRCPLAQLMFHTESFDTVVTLFGVCQVINDPAVNSRLWAEMPALGKYVSGPDDPSLGVLRFDTRRVEVLMLKTHGENPVVAEL